MRVSVDKTWQDGGATQVDFSCAGRREIVDIHPRPDREKSSAGDGDGFGFGFAGSMV